MVVTKGGVFSAFPLSGTGGTMEKDTALWNRYQKYLCHCPEINLTLDMSRMKFADTYFKKMEPVMHEALLEMSGLEGGAIANADENRMVGHYWLRDPSLAPSRKLRDEIESTVETIHIF